MKSKAAILESLRAPLVLGELDVPAPGVGQVLVQVHRSGICGAQIGEIDGKKVFGDGEDRRDHLSIGDVGELVGLCLRHRTTGILNAVTGISMSFREIAEIIADSLPGTSISTVPRQLPLSHRCFDNRALAAAFPGFCPTLPETGIRALIAALQALPGCSMK